MITELAFLLTRPLRDVTQTGSGCIRTCSFLLTRPLRDVTVTGTLQSGDVAISTHTPLAGRDAGRFKASSRDTGFLLTRPLRDVTSMIRKQISINFLFLLTRPLRDVTLFRLSVMYGRPFLLTRPLRDVT